MCHLVGRTRVAALMNLSGTATASACTVAGRDAGDAHPRGSVAVVNASQPRGDGGGGEVRLIGGEFAPRFALDLPVHRNPYCRCMPGFALRSTNPTPPGPTQAGRAIGPGGTLARVVFGIRVAWPSSSLVTQQAAGRLVRGCLRSWSSPVCCWPGKDAERGRGAPRLLATGPLAHFADVGVFFALSLSGKLLPALDAQADAALIFYGSSMPLAAIRGYAGCEVLAVSNWILRRDDQVGCAVFFRSTRSSTGTQRAARPRRAPRPRAWSRRRTPSVVRGRDGRGRPTGMRRGALVAETANRARSGGAVRRGASDANATHSITTSSCSRCRS